jgi:hypothetical protein
MAGSEDVVKCTEKGGDVIKTVMAVTGERQTNKAQLGGSLSFLCLLVDFVLTLSV